MQQCKVWILEPEGRFSEKNVLIIQEQIKLNKLIKTKFN